ncbi:hypothetical protein [Sodalis sp. RH19]|uniref:hypothetical protein n=1 Tax=Sodalis sp. RH19 TaxID=3394334 RepID=UPI0039B42ACE
MNNEQLDNKNMNQEEKSFYEYLVNHVNENKGFPFNSRIKRDFSINNKELKVRMSHLIDHKLVEVDGQDKYGNDEYKLVVLKVPVPEVVVEDDGPISFAPHRRPDNFDQYGPIILGNIPDCPF